MRTLIVDDQTRSRRVLVRMIKEYCPEINIVGEADNVERALELIHKTKPDLIFLDVDLGNGTGFDVLGELGKTISFQTIFVTAHESFAIKAIKWSAQDYLLKPVDPDELIASVNKVKSVTESKSQSNSDSEVYIHCNKIGLPIMEGLRFVLISNIIRCEAKGPYTEFYLNTNEKVTVSKSIQVYEQILNGHNFFRVHKSHIINLDHIKEYIKGRGGCVVMIDGAIITVATRKKEDFLKHILH